MRSTLLLATALVAGAGLSMPMFADSTDTPPPGMHDHMHEPALSRALKQINLSSTQQASIHEFFIADHSQMESHETVLHSAWVAYETAQPGTATFTTAAATLADAEADAARSRVQSSAEIRTKIDGVLTADQRSQLASLLSQYASEVPPKPMHTPAQS